MSENIIVEKSVREITVQARREIEQEWSTARILEKQKAKKENAESIVAR